MSKNIEKNIVKAREKLPKGFSMFLDKRREAVRLNRTIDGKRKFVGYFKSGTEALQEALRVSEHEAHIGDIEMWGSEEKVFVTEMHGSDERVFIEPMSFPSNIELLTQDDVDALLNLNKPSDKEIQEVSDFLAVSNTDDVVEVPEFADMEDTKEIAYIPVKEDTPLTPHEDGQDISDGVMILVNALIIVVAIILVGLLSGFAAIALFK